VNLRKDHLQLVIELFWALAWTAEGVGGGGGGGGGLAVPPACPDPSL